MIISGLAAALIVAFTLGVVVVLKGRYGPALGRYIDSIRSSDVAGAYGMLCSASKQETTVEEFAERLEVQLAGIGRIEATNRLHGEPTIGYTVLQGQRQTRMALTPMKKEQGRWKPCPTREEPLGHLVAPP